MPELPEVRAHAERLTADFAGARLDAFRALSFTALKTFAPPPEAAVGTALERVATRGKALLLAFEHHTFAVHLMQGGRLKPDPKQAAKVKGGLARWRFDDGRALLLTEAGTDHKAGVWVRDGGPAEAGAQEPFAEHGPDADVVTLAELTDIVRRPPSGRLHGFLRDQHRLAGLGRRLANEVCWTAQLSPFAATGKLRDDEVARLHEAIATCIADSLTSERARDDMSSSKDRPGAVHHREKQACPRCGDAVRAVEYVRYTVNYCATCQTGGKVLADNTTSKFLK
jgi:formamidopyrimidine-DNA glycosylase